MSRRAHVEFIDRLGTLTRAVRAVAAERYEANDVPVGQAKFLLYIGTNAPISHAELARATRTDPALTGRVLEAMIERGWVKRTRSEDDRRQYVLELTATGQRARKRVDKARSQLAAHVGTILDEADMDDFERIAGKLLAALDAEIARKSREPT